MYGKMVHESSARAWPSSRRCWCCSAPGRPSRSTPSRGAIRPSPRRASPISRAGTWRARRPASAWPQTTLFDICSAQTSTGSVTGSNDSFTPIGGMGLLTSMMLGEVSPGGAGAGMYTILAFAIIAVFIGGLMVGRTPEYLGKKIQSREVKLAGLLVLVMPMLVLVFTAIAVSIHAGRAGPLNGGPHGFSEILYAFTSPVNNNGSAFAGLSGNTPFYNVMQSAGFWFGRFAEMVPALALGGVLAQKSVVPAESAGTFRTDTPLFVGLFVGVILIVGALTFFPAVALGPIVEQLSHGKIYPTSPAPRRGRPLRPRRYPLLLLGRKVFAHDTRQPTTDPPPPPAPTEAHGVATKRGHVRPGDPRAGDRRLVQEADARRPRSGTRSCSSSSSGRS